MLHGAFFHEFNSPSSGARRTKLKKTTTQSGELSKKVGRSYRLALPGREDACFSRVNL